MIPKEVLDFMVHLDFKHEGGRWHDLPNDHPDIVKLQSLSPFIKTRQGRWTDECDNFLKENFMEMDDDEIGERLGFSGSAVSKKRHEFKLYRVEKSKRVRVIDIDGSEMIYESIAEAGRVFDISVSTVQRRIKKGTVSGRQWSYADEKENEVEQDD